MAHFKMSTKDLISILHNESYCSDSDLNELRKLLLEGADPNKINARLGLAAIHLAAAKDILTVQLLLKFGGNPNILNYEHLTPLHIASSWGHFKTVELLLQHGADVNLLDMDGKTAYDYAAEENHDECVCLLKRHIITSINKEYQEYKNVPSNTAINVVKTLPTSPGQSLTKQVFDILEERKHDKKFNSPEVSDFVPRSSSLQHKLNENHNTKSCSLQQEHHLHLNKKPEFFSCDKNPVSHKHSLLEWSTNVCDNRFALHHVNPDLKVADFILSSDSFTKHCSLSADSNSDECSISSINDSASTYTTCCEVSDCSELENLNSNKTDNYKQHTNKGYNLFIKNLDLKSKQLQRKDQCLSDTCMKKTVFLDDSIFSTISFQEIIHHDAESNITFLEKHLSSDISDDEQIYSSANNENFSDSSQKTTTKVNIYHKPALFPKDDTLQRIPNHLLKLTCQEISHRLNSYGEVCGPVTHLTKNVYLRKLAVLETRSATVNTEQHDSLLGYPSETAQALKGIFDECGMNELELKMMESFNSCRNWREGTEKSSFTYILLDPQITDNLPLRAKFLSTLEVFQTFLLAIFYIGKGKASRPYSHLNEAYSQLTNKNTQIVKYSRKVQKIINIWESGYGVVSVHCFHSTIPAEAYTREACMIEAIGLQKLTNMKRGDFYGDTSTWTQQQKRKMGVFLLQKALQIFLADGERQIYLLDINKC